MSELKITTHTTYTYETSDGREFDKEAEAREWQEVLEIYEHIPMLDFRYKPTKDPAAVMYMYLKDQGQLKAFCAVQDYEGLAAQPTEPGHYKYDDISDEFIHIENEIIRLQDIISKLDTGNWKD